MPKFLFNISLIAAITLNYCFSVNAAVTEFQNTKIEKYSSDDFYEKQKFSQETQ